MSFSSFLPLVVQYGIPLALLGLAPLAALLLRMSTSSSAKSGKAYLALSKLEHFASLAVAGVDASPLKAAILDAAKDGSISPAEGAKLKDLAVSDLKHLLGTAGLDEVKSALGVTDAAVPVLLSAQVEKAVADKNAVASVP